MFNTHPLQPLSIDANKSNPTTEADWQKINARNLFQNASSQKLKPDVPLNLASVATEIKPIKDLTLLQAISVLPTRQGLSSFKLCKQASEP
jgi:hypothetical protein